MVFQVSWIQAETKAILTMNGHMVTQNPRYSILTQVRAVPGDGDTVPELLNTDSFSECVFFC